MGTPETFKFITESIDVSIQLGSPASGDIIDIKDNGFKVLQGFPFNWDPQRVGTLSLWLLDFCMERVSIQLGSPASGDKRGKSGTPTRSTVSIQLGSPASGDRMTLTEWWCGA